VARRAVIALWLALFLLVAQQAAALHELAHAIDQFAPQKHLPPKSDCDLCLAIAPLSGAVGPTVLTIPAIAAEPPRALVVAEISTPVAAPVYFLSQGPPAALHA
jgi:hypothetical protein